MKDHGMDDDTYLVDEVNDDAIENGYEDATRVEDVDGDDDSVVEYSKIGDLQ